MHSTGHGLQHRIQLIQFNSAFRQISFAAAPRGDVVSPELFWRAEEAADVEIEAAFEKQEGVETLAAEVIVFDLA